MTAVHVAASSRFLLHHKSKMAAIKPEVVIIQAIYEIYMKFQQLSHHFQDGIDDCRPACGRFQQISVTPQIQDGGCEIGNSYNYGAVSDRYAVPKAKTFVSTTAIKTIHAAIVSNAQIHGIYLFIYLNTHSTGYVNGV
jgi:hypothetical protein